MRAWIRAARLLTHVSSGLLLAALLKLDIRRRIRPEVLVHWWNTRLLRILDVEVRMHGRPARGARFTAPNHVSWLDIPVLGACAGTRFVSKAEVRHWPVAGWLANASGTFYLERGRGGTRPLIEALTPHLAAGGSVVVFAEATTTDGSEVRNFYSRLFAAAVDSGAPVQPVAICYGPGDQGQSLAPFVGDDDLFSHMLRVLRNSRLQVDIHFLPTIASTDMDRDQLARLCQRAVSMQVLQSATRPLVIPSAANAPELET